MKSINRIVLFIVTLMTITVSAEGKQNCDKLGINFYDNIGCAREHSEGGCPSYSSCRYERPRGACLLNGVVYRDREYINNENDILCNNGCRCEAPNNKTKGIFSRPMDGCPEDWVSPVKPGCYLEYGLNDCCGNEQCEHSEVSCVVDGVTYKKGERFYPKDECVVCVCTSEFNGKYDGPNCTRSVCGVEMNHASKIERNCAPTYYADPNTALCCPQNFICPSDDDKFTGSADTNSTLTCTYGNKTVKPGVRLTREIEEYGKKRTVTCECKLPPLLTCTA